MRSASCRSVRLRKARGVSDETPCERWVRDWERGRGILAEVRAVKDWLQEQFPDGGELSDADCQRRARKASAERWQPEALKAGMAIWHLSTIVDATDKLAA